LVGENVNDHLRTVAAYAAMILFAPILGVLAIGVIVVGALMFVLRALLGEGEHDWWHKRVHQGRYAKRD
jgi:hypothetical protein